MNATMTPPGRRGIQVAPIVLGVAMIATAIGVEWWQPEFVTTAAHQKLAQSIPTQFGDWKEVAVATDQVDPGKGAADEPNMDRPYDDVLMRAYENSRGDIVLLALAYGRNQRQEVKIHRPDVCYTAQGFQLVERSPVVLPVSATNGTPVHGMRMLVKAPGRVEAVSYWIRIGEVFTDNAWSIRYHILKRGLAGHAVDGVLVRASQIIPGREESAADRYRLQEAFLADLVRALPDSARQLLLG